MNSDKQTSNIIHVVTATERLERGSRVHEMHVNRSIRLLKSLYDGKRGFVGLGS
jgi:hypothetical protein